MSNGRGPDDGMGTGKRTGRRSPVQAVFYWLTIAVIWIAIFGVAFIGVMAIDLPDISKLDNPDRQPSITYLDRSGALIAVRGGSQASAPVKIEELPDYVPLAFVAIEDRRFFTHPGFDPVGISRALLRNLSKKKAQIWPVVRPSPSNWRGIFPQRQPEHEAQGAGTDDRGMA